MCLSRAGVACSLKTVARRSHAGLVEATWRHFTGALMELLVQRCFDGMFTGAIYASLALAIVMIYRSTGLLNFAQGEMGLMGGYVTLTLL